jgi:hypothetical protein
MLKNTKQPPRKRAPGAGRKPVLAPCPWCGKEYGMRQMREHFPKCPRRPGKT